MRLLACAMGCGVALVTAACGGEGRIDDPANSRFGASTNVMVADGTCEPGTQRDCVIEEDGTMGTQWCTQERTVRGWTSCEPSPVDDPSNPEFGNRRDGGADDPSDPEFGNRRDGGVDDPSDPEFGNRRDGGADDPTDPEFGNRRDGGADDPTDPEFGNRRDGGTDDANEFGSNRPDSGVGTWLPPGLHDCKETEGGDCNLDLGYGDHCASSDNWGGCSEEKFWAWCNRRNPDSALGDLWRAWVHDWVADRCDGEITEDDNHVFSCTTGEYSFECKTPLVLAFVANEPVRYLQTPNDFVFDAPTAGRVDWPRAATPWLAFDRNGNGRIDDGSELFGSATVLTSGRRAVNGFEALAELDGNHDGKVDSQDKAWSRLLVWRDVDGNGVSRAHELQAAQKAGLASIDLAFRTDVRCDARGNCERERAGFQWRTKSGEKRSGEVIDVYLKVQEPVQLVSMP
ncbi:MAG: hypothetical protein HY901_19225 [Deltaproteobacteria bacterium]|nr:hypothetical protein [Deltaproteobacteria bacterium]